MKFSEQAMAFDSCVFSMAVTSQYVTPTLRIVGINDKSFSCHFRREPGAKLSGLSIKPLLNRAQAYCGGVEKDFLLGFFAVSTVSNPRA
jgi:hypothetical protein